MATTEDRRLETLSPLFLRTSISICLAASILVSYRLYSVWRRRGWFGPEDAIVGVSLVFLVAITIIGCEACRYGFGYHIRDIARMGGSRSKALLCFWLFQIFYKIVICCNKLAFLFLYLQLFPQHTVRKICWLSIAIVIAGTLSFVLSTVLECLPISRNWNRTGPGHCINNTAFRWSWAGFNTLTDLWVLLLPIPIILKLQMSLLRRVGASVIFALGIFIVAVSCFRMKALFQSVTRADTTWDSAPAFIWSHVEAAVGLIATCLPALKQPISRILPKRITGTATSLPAGETPYKMHSLSGRMPTSLSGSIGYNKERNAVYVTTQPKVLTSTVRESQERILDCEPGILVTRNISVQSANVRDCMGVSCV